MHTASDVIVALESFSNPERAQHSQRFFKTGKGEYGENDVFIGLTVPQQRKVAKKFTDLSLSDIEKLLTSDVHEHRFTGLVILVNVYKKGEEMTKKKVYDFYLKHLYAVNNWDLVDTSAPNIVGEYLSEHVKERNILYTLATSMDLWEKRVAILSTFAFIKRDDFDDTLAISEILLEDSHDLIHKAVGWMLREVGKRDQTVEEVFLKKHADKMPRTMLRYAIEKFNEPLRQYYINLKNKK